MRIAYKGTNSLNERWTAELIADGLTALPTILLQLQSRLGLAPVDLNIVLQLASHWREASQLPYEQRSASASPEVVRRRRRMAMLFMLLG
jgi:hypothetical protein